MDHDFDEIVLEVERAFHIRLDTSRLGCVKTVGDLYRLVLEAMELRADSVCLSSRSFYRIRRGLVEVAGTPRSAVRLDTALDDFFPPDDRRARWSRLAEATAMNLPPLERPPWVERFVFLAHRAAACGLVFLVLASFMGMPFGSLDLGLIASVGYVVVWCFLAVGDGATQKAFGNRIPAACPTPRRLVETFLPSLRPARPTLASEELWLRLRTVISNDLGVPLERVTEDALWAEDLGCG